MKLKNLNLSICEENGEVFFNIDIPEIAPVEQAEEKSPTVEIAPQIKTESCLFNYGWCTSPLGLNIRETTDLECKVIGVLDNGQRFKIENVIEANEKRWYEISLPMKGFIDAEFTAVCEDTTEVNEDLINFTASWESFRPRAYRDAGGEWTIGFGDCTFDDEPTYTVTYDEAWNTLKTTLNNFASQVAELTQGLNLNQNEFNALVDFCYNLGVRSLKESNLFQYIKECQSNAVIIPAFDIWDGCDGRQLEGLERRRQAEANMFLYGQYDNN